MPSTIVTWKKSGIYPLDRGIYPRTIGIKLDLCFCTIPTVGLYGKLGEITATHFLSEHQLPPHPLLLHRREPPPSSQIAAAVAKAKVCLLLPPPSPPLPPLTHRCRTLHAARRRRTPPSAVSSPPSRCRPRKRRLSSRAYVCRK